MCICHPHSQGVLLTHFGSCLEPADSETQIRCHRISTLASRGQSQPICTHPCNDIFGISHVATYPEIPFEAVLICKSEGRILCICHPLSGCARTCRFRNTNSMPPYSYPSSQISIPAHMHTPLEIHFRDCPCRHMLRDSI